MNLLPALEDGTDRGFRNVGRTQTDAGDIPKRTHTVRERFIYLFTSCSPMTGSMGQIMGYSEYNQGTKD